MRIAIVAIGLGTLTAVGEAQRPEGAELLTKQAVAESLKVLATLNAQAEKAPTDAALQYRIGRIAFALVLRSRMRDTVPGLDRTALQQIAIDALSKAVNINDRNVDYLLTYASFLTWNVPGKQNVQLAAQMTMRANRVAMEDPNPATRGRIVLRMADGAWLEYEKSLIDTLPMEGFTGAVPDRPLTERPAEKRGIGSSPENLTPLPPSRTGATGGSGGDMVDYLMKLDMRPYITLHNGDQPMQTVGPRSIGEAIQGTKLDGTLSRTTAVASMRAIERLSRKGDDRYTELQERHYLLARMLYDSAYAIIPADAGAWRGVSKTRLERNDWSGVLDLAEEYIKRSPADQWGYLALGLARQRKRETPNARAAFDSGLARMPATERAHLDRVDRLMRPKDVREYSSRDSAGRAAYDAVSWFLADPLWSVDAEEPRLEFLARLTHAEIRWGKLNPRVYGADTDDGIKFVRYGPTLKRLNNLSLYPGGLIMSTCGVWLGTALCGKVRQDEGLIQAQFNWQPARWDNIATIDIDSMPVQAVRFRVAGDSVDFFLATRAPVAKLDSVATNNVSPFAKLWIHGWNSPIVEKDSLGLTPAGTMQWTRRLPAGAYNYRVEAVMPGTLAAGRATDNIIAGNDTTTGFAMFGFGMSDLLLASSATMAPTARRWSDVDFVPTLGTVNRKGQISVIWENYEVGRRGDAADYHVTLTLAREETFSSKLSLDVIDGISSLIRRSSKNNQLMLDFDRLVPFAPTIVDNLTLGFGDTPAGVYNLTVAVTDKVSGRRTARTTRIVIQGK